MTRLYNRISWAWDYTVLCHFQCFSMRISIVKIKLLAYDSVQSTYHERPMDYTSKTYGAESRYPLFIIVKIKNLF
jgi:hypothetical protein